MVSAIAWSQTNRFDVNLDHEVNVSDVTTLVDYILSGQGYNVRYDVYEDGCVDVVDVTALVDFILGKGPTDAKRHNCVDLGLPSGTLWADCNMGAGTSAEYGDFYSWGEVATKNDYTRASYQYYKKGSYQSIGENICATEYDAAYVNWGGKWRLPTQVEVSELMNQCSWKAKTINSVYGYEVTGPNGNAIFMPCSGYCYEGTTPNKQGVEGYYWTGNQVPGRLASAYSLSTSDIGESWWTSKYFGYTIRPVRSK